MDILNRNITGDDLLERNFSDNDLLHRNISDADLPYPKAVLKTQEAKKKAACDVYKKIRDRSRIVNDAYQTYLKNCKGTVFHFASSRCGSVYKDYFETWYNEARDDSSTNLRKLGSHFGKVDAFNLRNYLRSKADSLKPACDTETAKLSAMRKANQQRIDDEKDIIDTNQNDLDYQNKLEELKKLEEQTKAEAAKSSATLATTKAVVATANLKKILAYSIIPLIVISGVIAIIFITKK